MSDEFEDQPAYRDLKCDIFIKSIGYKSLPMPGVPWDSRRCVIPQNHGCVLDSETN